MSKKTTETIEACSIVSAIISIFCLVICVICHIQIGVFSDEFDHFSFVGFYGSDGLNTADLATLGLYFLIMIGSCYAHKRGRLFSGVLLALGLFTLGISFAVLYYNIRFLNSFQLSLADAYGGKVIAFLFLFKIFLTLVCCVLLAVILGMKCRNETTKNK